MCESMHGSGVQSDRDAVALEIKYWCCQNMVTGTAKGLGAHKIDFPDRASTLVLRGLGTGVQSDNSVHTSVAYRL